MEIKLEQGSAEWLEFRKSKLGASDANIIMNAKYCTPYMLWCRKLGYEPEQKQTPAMARGHALESEIRDEANAILDSCFDPTIFISDDMPWAMASLDGWDGERIMEIKTANAKDHAYVLETQSPPPHYWPQIQWQFYCTGAKEGFYVSNFKCVSEIIEVERDDEYIQNSLVPAMKNFYYCMTNEIAPELSEKDYRYISSEEFDMLASAWKFENRCIKTHKQECDAIKKQLEEFASKGNCRGSGIRMRHVSGRQTIDYKKLWEDAKLYHPELEKVFDICEYITNGKGYILIEEESDNEH